MSKDYLNKYTVVYSMGNAVNIGTLADKLGINALSPGRVTVVQESKLSEADVLAILTGSGLNVKERYDRGDQVPVVEGDFLLDFGSYIIRARIPRDGISLQKSPGYKRLNGY